MASVASMSGSFAYLINKLIASSICCCVMCVLLLLLKCNYMRCASDTQLYCAAYRSLARTCAAWWMSSVLRAGDWSVLTIVYGEWHLCRSNPLSRLWTNLMAVCKSSQLITAVCLFSMVYIWVCVVWLIVCSLIIVVPSGSGNLFDPVQMMWFKSHDHIIGELHIILGELSHWSSCASSVVSIVAYSTICQTTHSDHRSHAAALALFLATHPSICSKHLAIHLCPISSFELATRVVPASCDSCLDVV